MSHYKKPYVIAEIGCNHKGEMEIAKELKAEAINPQHTQLNAENVSSIHKAGFKVYTWTVNDPAEFHRLVSIGVDGVFSDFPDRMK